MFQSPAVATPDLLVSRISGTEIQLVRTYGDGRPEKIVHRRSLPLADGMTFDGAALNSSQLMSMAFVVDRTRNRIAFLNVDGFQTLNGVPALESVQLNLKIVTLDYEGHVVQRTVLKSSGAARYFLGFDEEGKGTLIRQTNLNRFQRLTKGAWQAANYATLPYPFQRAAKDHDPTRLAALGIPKDRPFTEVIGRSAEWLDCMFPGFTMFQNPMLTSSFDDSRKASLIADRKSIWARWDTKRISTLGPNGIWIDTIAPLDSPRVLIRSNNGDRLADPLNKAKITGVLPYLPSRIGIYDLTTKTVKWIGNGFYAVPL